jgi:hypothetical protein
MLVDGWQRRDDPHFAARSSERRRSLAIGRSEPRICLDIRDAAHCPKADEILINLGSHRAAQAAVTASRK